jgi:hypothetical protein
MTNDEMNAKSEKERQKYIKWRYRVEKLEARVAEAVCKATSQRNKLWKSCPHKWESTLDKDPKVRAKAWKTCGVCGVVRSAFIEEMCLESL